MVDAAADGFMHADSPLWRTLGALLFRPGFLTQQFLAGHRKDYLSPFRLYIVISIVFFLIVPFTGRLAPKSDKSPVDVRQTSSDTHSGLRPDLRNSFESEAKPDSLNPSRRPGALEGPLLSNVDSEGESTPEQLCSAVAGHVPGPNWFRRGMLIASERAHLDHGRELQESFVRNLGRAMFLFLPLLAVFMKVMYWRPKRTFVTHLVLQLHNHAFVFLLMSSVLAALLWIRTGAVTAVLTGILMCYVTYYLYQSMRRVYGESSSRTLVKLVTLSVGYIGLAACTAFLTGVYSAQTL